MISETVSIFLSFVGGLSWFPRANRLARHISMRDFGEGGGKYFAIWEEIHPHPRGKLRIVEWWSKWTFNINVQSTYERDA